MVGAIRSKIYSPAYDETPLHGVEPDGRPWDLLELLRSVCSSRARLVDVGAGTARKLLPLAAEIGGLWAVEPSAPMRARACELAAAAGLKNVFPVGGMAEALPFAAGSFDVAASILAVRDAAELARVLRPGGVAVVETIGERDKAEIKEPFGLGADGRPRGRFLIAEGQRAAALQQEFGAVFADVDVRSGRWRTLLTPEGLIHLFRETNTIRDFDEERDARVLHQLFERCRKHGCIETVQHRVLIVARKDMT